MFYTVVAEAYEWLLQGPMMSWVLSPSLCYILLIILVYVIISN